MKQVFLAEKLTFGKEYSTNLFTKQTKKSEEKQFKNMQIRLKKRKLKNTCGGKKTEDQRQSNRTTYQV